ncbi:hypothetical protein V0R37_00515 [Pollutimonas sp. H1-120]|uniref:hypothetical protein n=1 Tax=Pollutimonas sp. H1-120 TaxID=3148824 RepID=UPI003B51E7DF
MLYVLSFFGLIFILLLARGLLAGTRKKKEMQDAACADYMRFKDDIKAWFANHEDTNLRHKADAAMRAINQSIKTIKFTRASDVKTAKQAALYTYAKEINALYNVDVVHDLTLPADIGDPIFRDAIDAHNQQTQNEAPSSTSMKTTANPLYSQNPTACPRCNHSPVAEILYGFPNFEDESLKMAVNEGRVALGGCVMGEAQPTWKCSNCGLDIFRSPASS